MTRRADELHPQLQDIEERRDARRVPESYAVTTAEARADLKSRLEGMTKYIDDEADEVRDFEIPGPAEAIQIRSYHPEGDGPHPIVVFYHGGGFVVGSVDSHDNVCTAFCDRAGALVLSVDYRLAPEHQFPAAVHDAYAALEWAATFGHQLGGDTDRIAVAGDSAGGNLAAVVSLLARNREGPEIARQVLIYPWLDPAARLGLDSYVENSREVANDREREAAGGHLLEQYAPDVIHRGNAYLAPLIAHEFSGLPPATIVTGGFDRLRDEGFEYAERLEAAGVDVSLANYEAMNHGFVSLLGLVDRADDAMDEMVDDLEASFA